MKQSFLSLLWMSLFQKPTELKNSKRGKEGIHSLLYEARNNVTYNSEEEHKFKQAIRDINPQIGLAQIATLGSEKHLKKTRFGHSPVGFYVSYQLTYTESNFIFVLIFPLCLEKGKITSN